MKTFDQLPEHPTVQPVVFPGYMLVQAECRVCGNEMLAVAPVGTEGITCPSCGHKNPDFAWVSKNRCDIAHDGAWLMGVVDLVGFSDEEACDCDECRMARGEFVDDDDDDPDLVTTNLPSWMVQMLAFLILLRQVFTRRH